MPPHLAVFDLELWCADGSTVAEAQARWDAEVAAWAEGAGVDSIHLVERLAWVDGTFAYLTG